MTPSLAHRDRRLTPQLGCDDESMQLLGHMNDVLFEPIVALGKGVEPSRSARIQRGSGIPESQLDSNQLVWVWG